MAKSSIVSVEYLSVAVRNIRAGGFLVCCFFLFFFFFFHRDAQDTEKNAECSKVKVAVVVAVVSLLRSLSSGRLRGESPRKVVRMTEKKKINSHRSHRFPQQHARELRINELEMNNEIDSNDRWNNSLNVFKELQRLARARARARAARPEEEKEDFAVERIPRDALF